MCALGTFLLVSKFGRTSPTDGRMIALFVINGALVTILLVMVHYECGLAALKTKRWGLLIARGLILLTAYTTYYMAFPALPLAEAIAELGSGT